MSTTTQLVPYTDPAREQDEEKSHHACLNWALGVAGIMVVLDLVVNMLTYTEPTLIGHVMNSLVLILIAFAGIYYNVREEKINSIVWYVYVTVGFFYTVIRVATITSALLGLNRMDS